ncbi:polysaccharide deacetylase family protein [Bacillus sp. 165]|uniref:polysaccharide deacetylase family protein n=1 Tax=Bacillus sp. 165 TaxID=1529117 RepID=UPI001ADC83E9|nr:polysaccharide deacetylase family protein [Bacillus sp. 165]MBO9128868.1 polysaccharide deacetylase family protein [Bacillus sp. 165]
MKQLGKLTFLAVIALFAYILVENTYITHYLQQIKADALSASKTQDVLYEEIRQKSKAYYIPPQDAVIDKIWKAMPGYNGLEVDIKASYDKMQKEGVFNEKKLVIKEISPKVHLGDLPPAPVYRGHPDKKMVAFTINVAWGNEYIPSMLEILKKHGVTATFFLEGRWAKENPTLAKMIADAKQEVGNHSYTHPDMKTLSTSAIQEQLVKTNEVIEATTDQKVKWFAPPSGSYRDAVVDIASQLGMRTIMWTVDTIDWQRPDPSVLINRVMRKVHPGAIVLMHPTSSTAKSLDTLIKNLKKQGYEIGDVSTLLNEKRMDR